MDYEKQLIFLQQLLRNMNISSCILENPEECIPPEIDLNFRADWHGRKFCVSDIRQREGSHAINVDRKGITPCLLQSPEDGAVCALSTA